jgi:hypothetical protein
MPPIVIDLVIAALILGMTYALMSEGLWGAALMFFNVLFAGIIAFNFYEPLAALLAKNLSFLSGFADTLCMLSIFVVAVVLLRLTTESLAPAMVRFPSPIYHAGRIFFGFAGSVITIAIILLAYEAAPVHKKVFTVVDYKYKPPFKLGIDHEWLGFFQYTTGLIFSSNRPGTRDPFTEYGSAKVFDPKAEWLIRHQDARPYGTETVLEEPAAAGGAAAAAGGAPGPAAAPGGAPGGGAREGDPKVIGVGPGGGVVIPPPN